MFYRCRVQSEKITEKAKKKEKKYVNLFRSNYEILEAREVTFNLFTFEFHHVPNQKVKKFISPRFNFKRSSVNRTLKTEGLCFSSVEFNLNIFLL